MCSYLYKTPPLFWAYHFRVLNLRWVWEYVRGCFAIWWMYQILSDCLCWFVLNVCCSHREIYIHWLTLCTLRLIFESVSENVIMKTPFRADQLLFLSGLRVVLPKWVRKGKRVTFSSSRDFMLVKRMLFIRISLPSWCGEETVSLLHMWDVDISERKFKFIYNIYYYNNKYNLCKGGIICTNS